METDARTRSIDHRDFSRDGRSARECVSWETVALRLFFAWAIPMAWFSVGILSGGRDGGDISFEARARALRLTALGPCFLLADGRAGVLAWILVPTITLLPIVIALTNRHSAIARQFGYFCCVLWVLFAAAFVTLGW